VILFEWDDRKAARNIRDHGVSFDEAETVFDDEHALLIDDPDHSAEEERYVLLGLSSRGSVLVVCHCYRPGGDDPDLLRPEGEPSRAQTL
jgi:uncharacterized protein